jgi:CHAT domain-containing protein
LINLDSIKDGDNAYLFEKYEIRVLPSSGELIKENRGPDGNNEPSVLIAYPAYNLGSEQFRAAASKTGPDELKTAFRGFSGRGNGKIGLLPGTREEAITISGLLESKNMKASLFLSEDAVEERVKAVESPKVLHIATHGFFSDGNENTGNPLLSTGLLFTGAAHTLSGNPPPPEIEDGVLTAYEALQLHLKDTELVVLSACETGLGKLKAGEGAYNLQRAFSIAGAKYVVMSLWQVDDRAAKEFMVLFYENWLSSGKLREAFRVTVERMKDLGYPRRDWSAFVLIGP